MKKIKIKAKKDYSRIDHFLNESLTNTSRSKIEKLIKLNKIKLNNQIINRKNRQVLIGDIVEVEPMEIEKKTYLPSQELKKLFEDDHIIIIDKPCGISVHPGAGKSQETILDIFRFYYPQINEKDDTSRPGIVHRLDKDTSGILLLAKNVTTKNKLQEKFKKRAIKKTYLGIVTGKMRYLNGTINVPITRSRKNRRKFIVASEIRSEKTREAITKYSVIKEFSHFSLLKLFPLTGRTHQIRVHLSHYGNPILGDKIYGRGIGFERLALHAYSIEFIHPNTGYLIVSYSPFPKIFRNFIQAEIKKQPHEV